MGNPTKTGGPAFPLHASNGPMGLPVAFLGLTMRDFFAAHALAGLLAMAANPDAMASFAKQAGELGLSVNEFLARDAYAKAEAMVTEAMSR